MARTDEAGGVDGQDPMRELGRQISVRRKKQNLTLVALAGLTGLSQPFLSQIERGRAQPSMSSLHRIARALGTVTPELLSSAEIAPVESQAEIDSAAVSLVRVDQGLVTAHEGSQVKSLVAGDRAMYPLEFQVATVEFEDYYEHPEPEFIYVIAGRIEVDLDTEGRHLLNPGDTLYFGGTVRHRWRVVGVWPARLLVVQAHALADGSRVASELARPHKY